MLARDRFLKSQQFDVNHHWWGLKLIGPCARLRQLLGVWRKSRTTSCRQHFRQPTGAQTPGPLIVKCFE